MEWEYHKIDELARITRIYTIFEKSYKADYNFSGESHDFWECVYVESGSICVTADSRVLELSAGEIIFHKPLELHKFFVDSPKGATLFIFSFSFEGEFYEKISNKVCRLDGSSKRIMISFLEHLRTAASQSEITFSNDYINFYKLLPYNTTLPQMAATYITQLILSVSNNDSARNISTAADAKLFSKAVDFMHEHISESLSIDELAGFLGVSRSGIGRIFDKYAKMGAHKYFTSLKISKATKLLESGLGVGETAEQLGYSSQAYFSAAYKRETGKNPSCK